MIGDEINQLLEAFGRTGQAIYLNEARIILEAAGNRLARCRPELHAYAAEIDRLERLAAEVRS